MSNYFGDLENQEALTHYGIKRRSGRYPWGSGKNPYQNDPRYTNSNGTPTKEGKKKAIADYKYNSAAAETFSNAVAIRKMINDASNENLNKAQRKYDKKPTEENKNKLDSAKRAAIKFRKMLWICIINHLLKNMEIML